MKKQSVIAQIHTHQHVNLYRSDNDVKDGPATLDEQIKGVTRMLRWHARQAAVANQLLTRLENERRMVTPEVVG